MKIIEKKFLSKKNFVIVLSLVFFTIKLFGDIKCTVCGEINPYGSKFCGFCGAPIDIETLKPQKKIEIPQEFIEYSRKPEVELKTENKTSLILGLLSIIFGCGMSIYGFSKEEITEDKIVYSQKLESLNNYYVDGYYYPKGNFRIKNFGNTVSKNFLVRIKFYDNSENLIRTEYVNLPFNIEPEKEISQTVETDTGKNSVYTTKVELVDYQVENVYKIKNENLGWGGVVVFCFGIYNLIDYYNQTVYPERYISKHKNNWNFRLVMVPQKFYINFGFKI